MGLTKYKLGDLIEQTTQINDDMEFSKKDVKGMTITKEIVPTKADVSTTDLSKFLVIHPKEFVFNPRTHGKHIGLGYNDTKNSFIISWNNIGFRVKEKKQNIIDSKYLFLHFKRDEWDREACFNSWGSSTEVFTWIALCEMEISLPEIKTQQKYVDIYNSMVANQQSYEQGLDDLKLVCDGYIEDLRRKMPCEKIGRYIKESSQRNSARLTEESLRGISTNKEFIQTKANMNEVSLDNYKIIEPNQIAYVPDTSRRNNKISLAINNSNDIFLVSSIYTVFSTISNKLIPQYLMLFFSRSEFDRYARFNSWGSAREVFDWNELCNVRIPIPGINVQKAIVNIYSSYITRKNINEKLKEKIKNICPILIKGSLEEAQL